MSVVRACVQSLRAYIQLARLIRTPVHEQFSLVCARLHSALHQGGLFTIVALYGLVAKNRHHPCEMVGGGLEQMENDVRTIQCGRSASGGMQQRWVT